MVESMSESCCKRRVNLFENHKELWYNDEIIRNFKFISNLMYLPYIVHIYILYVI